MRMSKLRTSVDAFVKSEGVHAKLDHLTAMEINGIRPLLPHALDQMLRIQSVSIDFGQCLDFVFYYIEDRKSSLLHQFYCTAIEYNFYRVMTIVASSGS